MYYNIQSSKPRRQFKRFFGQANHFLITSLVGLDYLSKNDVKCPDSFSTVWCPYDKENSVSRSRAFLLGSFLSSSVDALDSYFFMINRSPKLISEELQSLFDATQNARSVFNKFEIIYNRYNSVIDLRNYGALVAMSIQWRNNRVHFNSNNTLDEKYISVLASESQFFEQECRGLDISLALDHFKNNDPPTFKEMASIINATHRFVQVLDECLIDELDLVSYSFNILLLSWGENSGARLKTVTKERALEKITKKLIMEGFTPNSTKGLGKKDIELLYDRLIRNDQ